MSTSSSLVSLPQCESWISSNLSALNDSWTTEYDNLLSYCSTSTATSTDEWTQSIHVAAIFIIMICSTLGAGLPLLTKYVKALAVDPYYFYCGKAIGIGIILSCGLVHMLQPASASLTDPSLPYEFSQDYNAYAFLYAMLAILAMNAMDYCVLKLSRKWILEKIQEVRAERANKQKAADNTNAQSGGNGVELQSPSNVKSNANDKNENIQLKEKSGNGNHAQENNNNNPDNRLSVVVFHGQQASHGTLLTAPKPADIETTNTNEVEKSSDAVGSNSDEVKCDNCDGPVKGSSSSNMDGEIKFVEKGHSHDMVQQLLIMAQELPAEYSYLLKFGMLEFGLTVHSVLIGITEGVAADTRFKTLLVALVFHQFFEGVALGSRLAASNISKIWHAALLVIIFAVSAPIGISLGIGIVNNTSANGPTYLMTEGTFDAICGGILIYLGVNLLTHDFARDMEEVCTGKRYEGWMRLGLFTSLYTGAGVMSYIGKYL